MTENLAGRGEGLAGLAELDAISDLLHEHAVGLRSTNVLRAREIGTLASRLDRAQVMLETALEAAAPAGTPRNRSYLEDLKRDLRDESYAYEYLLACAQDSTEALRIGVRDVLAALATPSPQAPAEEKPPQHPFEVRINIGGDDWEYVRRAVRDLLEHVESREPGEVGCSSGGGGGCHSIDLQRRDVPVKQFREELQAWHQRLRAAKESK